MWQCREQAVPWRLIKKNEGFHIYSSSLDWQRPYTETQTFPGHTRMSICSAISGHRGVYQFTRNIVAKNSWVMLWDRWYIVWPWTQIARFIFKMNRTLADQTCYWICEVIFFFTLFFSETGENLENKHIFLRLDFKTATPHIPFLKASGMILFLKPKIELSLSVLPIKRCSPFSQNDLHITEKA